MSPLRIRPAAPFALLLIAALAAAPGAFAERGAGAAVGAVSDAGVPRWLAPAPRAENGRFTNPVGDLGHGGVGVRFPFFLRRMGGLFRARAGAPSRRDAGAAFFRAAPDPRAPSVTWIGHATLLVRMDGVTFLTDPIWSDRPSPIAFLGPRRFVAPGVALEDLPPIDFVVVSHNHYDHLDRPTLRRLAERDPETVFYVPLGNGDLLRADGLRDVRELDWTGRARHGDVEIVCLPAKHWSKRSLNDDHRALWSSWAVLGPTRRVYFAGDTGSFPGFREIGEAFGPFDLAAVPIGAYAPRAMMAESHMNPEEAWRAAWAVGARHALGMHYGTFDLSDEPLDEPPRRFRAAAEADATARSEGTPGVAPSAWLLDVGETRPF